MRGATRCFHEIEASVSAKEARRYRVAPVPEERARIDIGDFYGDAAKIRGTLGWKPRVALRDGLARTIEYYRQHKDHYL